MYVHSARARARALNAMRVLKRLKLGHARARKMRVRVSVLFCVVSLGTHKYHIYIYQTRKMVTP